MQDMPEQDAPAWERQQAQRPIVTKRKTAKTEESLLGALCTWIVEHQIGKHSNRGTQGDCAQLIED